MDTSTAASAIVRLANRAWPRDDLARRQRKIAAVLRWAGAVDAAVDDDVPPAVLAEVERVFGLIEIGELVAHQRVDGSFELRRQVNRPTPKRRKRARR